MGNKIMWTGLFLVVALNAIFGTAWPAEVVGAVLMGIGLVLYWMDK